jgi:hypothetical protein
MTPGLLSWRCLLPDCPANQWTDAPDSPEAAWWAHMVGHHQWTTKPAKEAKP